MSWSWRNKKEGIFCTVYFVRGYFLRFVFYLNAWCVEYISKNITSYTFVACFKIFGSFQCILKKGVLKNFAKFTGKHQYQSLFFKKLQAFNIFRDNNQLKYTQRLSAILTKSKKLYEVQTCMKYKLKNASNILNDALTIFDDFKGSKKRME